MERKPGSSWAVVLAAGEGSRMASLTRALYGRELPKQFAALDGDRTLLQRTMDRIAPVAPPHRTVVVVARAYEDLARAQLGEYDGVEIVTQPLNIGTGPGILLPLAHVFVRDPDARVTVFPSDHHVRSADLFASAVDRAIRIAPATDGGVVLLGAAAERPATDLGWIVRGAPLAGRMPRAWRVHRFVEKPPESVAMLLLGAGSLWNTMVLSGRAQSLWRLAQRHIPRQTGLFEHYLRHVGQPSVEKARDELYTQLVPADFSREVLQPARGLAVVPLIGAGWFDCGTPARLLEYLRATPEMATTLRRLQSAVAHAVERKASPAAQAAVS
jgi:mannose-1-phosphate guanylyltransferase